jgi:hypothetical protein
MYERDQAMKVAELGDTIFIAEATKTPISAMLKRGKEPNQMLSSWPVQKYPERKFGGTMDGFDIAQFTKTQREEMKGYAMWLITEGWMVSKLANLTKTAGVGKKERAHQAADDAIILAQMLERQLLSNMDTQAQTGASTPYQSRGMFSWLSATAQSNEPVPENFRPSSDCIYTGALASFMPANLEAMLEAAATAKKGPVDLMAIAGLKLKRQMSTWAQKVTDTESIAEIVRTTQSAAEKRIIEVVDFFEFDAGKVKSILSFYLHCDETDGSASDYTSRSGLFLDMSMWEIAFLQQAASYVLPPQSGGARGYHDLVHILRCLNPLGQCKVETAT